MTNYLQARIPFFFGSAVFVVGIFVSEHYGLYTHIAHFDKLMHVLGGIAIAWMAMALSQKDIAQLPRPLQFIGIVAVTCLVGVFWEFAEYLSNGLRTSHPWLYHYFHGGNIADTLGDLVADITGGLLFAVWSIFALESRFPKSQGPL